MHTPFPYYHSISSVLVKNSFKMSRLWGVVFLFLLA